VLLQLPAFTQIPQTHSVVEAAGPQLGSVWSNVNAAGTVRVALELSVPTTSVTKCLTNNNNNNNHDDIYSAAIYGASHMQEFTVVPLGQSQSAPGGRQLVGQAASLTFESACRLL